MRKVLKKIIHIVSPLSPLQVAEKLFSRIADNSFLSGPPFVPPIISAKSSAHSTIAVAESDGIEPEQLLSRFRNGMNVSLTSVCAHSQRSQAQKNKFSRHRCHLDFERVFLLLAMRLCSPALIPLLNNQLNSLALQLTEIRRQKL